MEREVRARLNLVAKTDAREKAIARARAAMLALTVDECAALVSELGYVPRERYADSMTDHEREHLRLVLQEAGGSPSKALEILRREPKNANLTERTFRRHLRAAGIAPAKRGRRWGAL